MKTNEKIYVNRKQRKENAMTYDKFKKDLQKKIDGLYTFLQKNLGDSADECLTGLDGVQETALDTAAEILEEDD